MEEYRVKTSDGVGSYYSGVTGDPKEAGNTYRSHKRAYGDGSTVELQKREVGPWKTVESDGSTTKKEG